MKISTLALSAALLGFLSAGSANALSPAGDVHRAATPHDFTLADYKKDDDHGHMHKYRPGSHHKKAPGGWHRFDKRPGDWNSRGCVVVGPIWYCP